MIRKLSLSNLSNVPGQEATKQNSLDGNLDSLTPEPVFHCYAAVS